MLKLPKGALHDALSEGEKTLQPCRCLTKKDYWLPQRDNPKKVFG